VVVSGWDVTAKERIEQRAEASCLGSELGSDSSGQELLEASFGERIERIVHEVPLSVEEAHTLAESTYRQMARRCLSGRAMCQGKAALRVGMHVCMEDLGPLFSGRYYVTEVTHCFDQPNGYRTFFNVERAGIGGV
jgi:phage protein D